MSTAPYVAIATVLDRVHTWFEEKRLEWEMNRLLLDDVEAGWIPEREMVGLTPVEPAAPPVDVDACSSCAGDGLVEVIDWMVTGGPVDVTCPRCGGTGDERGAA